MKVLGVFKYFHLIRFYLSLPLHLKVTKFKWYKNWHRGKLYKHVHVAILILYIFGILSGIMNYPQNVQAAWYNNKAWTTKSDFENGTNLINVLTSGDNDADDTNSNDSFFAQSEQSFNNTISAGNGFALAVKTDATLWTSGYNGDGSLGVGNQLPQVGWQNTGMTNVREVSAYHHSLVLKNDGTVWGAGNNDYGKIGDGTTSYRSSFVQSKLNATTPLTNIKKIIATEQNSYALSNDNKLYAVGYNLYYQLGTGLNTPGSVPYWQEVVSAGPVIDITAGSRDVMVLKYNSGSGKNEIWCLGNNLYGELGLGHNNPVTTWTQSVVPGDIVSVSMGLYHSVAIVNTGTDNGVVYTVGNGSDGRLGTGDSISRNTWTMTGINNVRRVFVGPATIHAIKNDATTWAVGYNSWGNLGVGDRLTRSVWSQVEVANISNISCGPYYTTLILKNDGSLFGVGFSAQDVFSTNKPSATNTYNEVLKDSGINDIDTTFYGSAYLKNGYGYVAGQNFDYRLGFADAWHKANFTQLPFTNVAKIEISEGNTYIVKSDKTLWAMGINSVGQIGVGSTSYSFSTLQQAKVDANNFLTNVEQISAGANHAIARTSNGDVYAVGYNNYGQIGDGTTTNALYWKLVSTGASKIFAGRYHSVVLKSDGTLQMVGYNYYGNYGIGTTSSSPITTWTTAATGVLDFYGGQYHNHIKKVDGIYAAGINGYGTLGDGTSTNRSTWLKINSIDVSRVSTMSQGYYNTGVLYTDGTYYTTGHNYYGQLGLGDWTARTSFTQVPVTGISKVSIGQYHTILYKSDGTLLSTGMDFYGQLGVGRQFYSNSWIQTNSSIRQPSPFLSTASASGFKVDGGQVSKWMSVVWDASVPTGTTLKLRARGAATEIGLDGATWGEWKATSGVSPGIQNSQWLELEVMLESSDGAFSPVINSIEIIYYTDISAPTNPDTVNAWLSSEKSTAASDSSWHNSSTPFFEWNGAIDDGDSGIKGYWVYFGNDATADPKTAGVFQVQNTFIANLSPNDSGKTYYLCISAEDNAGNLFNSSIEPYYKVFTYKYDPTPPDIITTNVTVLPVGWSTTNNFTFNWSQVIDPQNNGDASNIAGYKYKVGDEQWSNITTSLSIGGIQAYQNGQNIFYLKAIDTAGNESAMKETFYYYNADAPTKPLNLSVSPQTSTHNNFTFNWDSPSSFNGSIKGYYYSVNATPTRYNSVFVSSNSVGPIAAATQQSFNDLYVVAIDDSDNINWANYEKVTFECNTPAPGFPTTVEIFDTSNRDLAKYSLAVNWTEPAEKGTGFAGYIIERSVDQINYIEVGRSAGVSYIDTNLESKNYYYRVRSYNNSSNISAPSTVVMLKPTGKYTSPPTLTHGPEVATKVSTANIRWFTDREASSFVEIGETVSYNLTQGQFEFTTDHQVRIERLKPDTIYHYRVKFVDVDGNIGYSQDQTLKTMAAPYVTNVNIEDVKLNSAIISWNTTTPAQATILYGRTSSYSSSVENVSGGFTTSHSIILRDLSHSNKYYFRIKIKDIDNNEILSDEYSFETLKYPQISVVRLEAIKNMSTAAMKFTWDTNVPTTSIVEFQPRDGAVQETVKSKLELKHDLVITGLLDNTNYEAKIIGRDQFGNEAVSDIQRFKTEFDTRPPVIADVYSETSLSGFGLESKSQGVISWQTDEASTSRVEYSIGMTGNEYTFSTKEDASLTTSHVVVISDLKPSTTYHFRAISKDEAGNEVKSEDQYILTEQAKSSVLEIILRSFETTLGWLFN